jgi:hypothetical protein
MFIGDVKRKFVLNSGGYHSDNDVIILDRIKAVLAYSPGFSSYFSNECEIGSFDH